MNAPDKAKVLAVNRLFLTVQDVDDLYHLANSLPEKPVIVDLGAGSGTTAIAVYEVRPEATVFTVDNNLENLYWARVNLNANEIDTQHWVDVMRDASNCFLQENSVDFLMHDASHDYPNVINDIKAWHYALKPDALIWIHDYKPMFEDEYAGVKKSIDELISLGLIVKHEEATGIGFIARVVK